jgi:Ni,Fe-hydrogenase III small subunit
MTLSIDTFAAAAAAAVDCRPWPRFVLARADWQRLAAQPDPPLVALWANTAQVHGLFADPGRRQVLLASCDVAGGTYPALSPMRPGAAWFERVIADLWGHAAADGTDARGWLDHGRWPRAVPMAVHPGPPASAPEPPAFLPVPGAEEGGDLHQMPIGPVRQGIAEPGHLRLTCLGESVVRLEARLGYAHKGALVLLRGKSPRAAARYAARLSGDAAVAHAIAFAHATEAATDCPAPPRAAALRAVMAEMERIANHLGDLGAIGTAAGLATGPARLGYHREMLLRAAAIAFGHRLMMDVVVPGGIAADIAPGGAEAIHRALAALADALPALTRLPDAVAGQGGRLAGIGPVAARHAVAFAAGGPVARAAGLDGDARRWPGYAPYDALGFAPAVLTGAPAVHGNRREPAAAGASADEPAGRRHPGPTAGDQRRGRGCRGNGARRCLALAAAGSWRDRRRLRARSGLGQLAAAGGCDAERRCGRSGAVRRLIRRGDRRDGPVMDWRRTARSLLAGPLSPPQPAPPADMVAELAARLNAASQARLGRSLAIRHVNAGSCNGCELELRALTGILYDLERYGLRFVDSPRHADVLLATGPVTRNLIEALRATWAAMPEPKWVVAVGDCAVDGGVFKGSYAVAGGAAACLPVDLVIAGCPPTPQQILSGLRALLEAHAR